MYTPIPPWVWFMCVYTAVAVVNVCMQTQHICVWQRMHYTHDWIDSAIRNCTGRRESGEVACEMDKESVHVQQNCGEMARRQGETRRGEAR